MAKRWRWALLVAVCVATGCNAVATGAGPSTSRPSGGGGFVPSPVTKSWGCHQQGADPDPGCTPGALNPAVTQATIHQTICVSGYTKTIRPSVPEATRLKRLA